VPAAFNGLHPAPFLAVPGGVPLLDDGVVVGAIGIGGVELEQAHDLAQTLVFQLVEPMASGEPEGGS
jgi:uncharacterized protein GlcG (DUF336 family)